MLGVIKMVKEKTTTDVKPEKEISQKQKNEMPAGSYFIINGKLVPNLDDEAMKKRNSKKSKKRNNRTPNKGV